MTVTQQALFIYNCEKNSFYECIPDHKKYMVACTRGPRNTIQNYCLLFVFDLNFNRLCRPVFILILSLSSCANAYPSLLEPPLALDLGLIPKNLTGSTSCPVFHIRRTLSETVGLSSSESERYAKAGNMAIAGVNKTHSQNERLPYTAYCTPKYDC
jgi:hypothetical protein